MLIIHYINKNRTVGGFKPYKVVPKDFIIYRTSDGHTIGVNPKTYEQKLIEKSDDFKDTLEDEEALKILIKEEVTEYQVVQIPRVSQPTLLEASPIVQEHISLLTTIANSDRSAITNPYIEEIAQITRQEAKTLIKYLTENKIFIRCSTYWRLNKAVKKLLKNQTSLVVYNKENMEEKSVIKHTGYKDSENPMDAVKAELALTTEAEPVQKAKKKKSK